MKKITTVNAEVKADVRRDFRDAKPIQEKDRNRPHSSADPTITAGVKKVFDCYGKVLRKLADE